jgi:hypothetical protein
MSRHIEIPMDLPSLANQRLHWHVCKRQKARQRRLTGLYLRSALGGGTHSPPRVVTLTRVGKRLLDDDNLASAFKSVRDEVAAFFGVSDAPGGPICWKYEQGTALKPTTPYIVIEME